MLIRAWVQDGEIRGGGDWGQSSDLEAGVLEGSADRGVRVLRDLGSSPALSLAV